MRRLVKIGKKKGKNGRFGGTSYPETRLEQLAQELHTLDDSDSHTWSVGLLILMLVATGFLALVLPNVMWGVKTVRVNSDYLPQLFFGFLALIVLFSIYAFDKKRALQRARDELVRQLVRSEAAEMMSLVDPLTELFNRRYLDQIISKEVSRANRYGSELAVMMIDVDDFKSVNTRFGHLFGDRVLTAVADLLKATFRNSDIVIRYGGDEFLVILAQTAEHDAQTAALRLVDEVEEWNKRSLFDGYTMSLSYGLASFAGNQDAREVIETADAQMYMQKNRKLIEA